MKTFLHTLTATMLMLAAGHAAPPVNDNITKAVKLTGNYSTRSIQDLSQATADPMDPMISGGSAGKTLWYAFPYYPTSGNISFTITSTTGVGRAALYRANDAENPRGSLRELSVTNFAAGQTIEIASNYSGIPFYLMLSGTGQCQLTHRISVNTDNDFPKDAETLSGTSGSTTGNNMDATNTADEPVLPQGADSMTNIVWYKFTPNYTGMTYFDTNFSYPEGITSFSLQAQPVTHATQLALYVSASGGTSDVLTPLAYNGSGGFRNNSLLGYLLVNGSTYYIAVGTRSGSPGEFHLQHYRSTTPSEIYFETGDLSATSEGSEVHTVFVRRRYAGSGAASCTLTTSNDTATAGSDYVSLTTTVSFANAQQGANSEAWEVPVKISLLQDSLNENSYEKFIVTLSGNSAGSVLGLATGYAHIWDDESSSLTSLILPNSTFRVKESSGYNYVQVQRQYLVNTSYTALRQSAGSGTARPSQDFYLDNNGYIPATAAVGQCGVIPVNDNLFEPEETVQININNTVEYTLIIEDDDLYVPTAGKLTASLSYAGDDRMAVLYSTISSLGVLSGKLIMVNQTLPFTGKLDNRGKFQISLAPKNRGIIYLTFSAQDANGLMKVELFDADTFTPSSDTAQIQNFSPANPCPVAGLYTLRGSFYSDGSSSITCGGASSCKVDVSGNATITGKLFDGTSYTIAGYVDGSGHVSAITTLFSGQGYLRFTGPLPIANGSSTSVSVVLSRPARANDPAKFGGVVGQTDAACVRYTPPAAGAYVIEAWPGGAGKATLSGQPLAMMVTKALTITNKNAISAPADALKLKLAVVPATGMFSGSFVLPGTTQTLKIFGTFSDLPGMNGIGTGFFFNGKHGGKIEIGMP